MSLKLHFFYSDFLAMILILQEKKINEKTCYNRPTCSEIALDFLCRLLVTQFPHLCIVEDWLDDSMTVTSRRLAPTHKTLAKKCSVDGFKQGMASADLSWTFAGEGLLAQLVEHWTTYLTIGSSISSLARSLCGDRHEISSVPFFPVTE